MRASFRRPRPFAQIVYEPYWNKSWRTRFWILFGSVNYHPPITKDFVVYEDVHKPAGSRAVSPTSQRSANRPTLKDRRKRLRLLLDERRCRSAGASSEHEGRKGDGAAVIPLQAALEAAQHHRYRN